METTHKKRDKNTEINPAKAVVLAIETSSRVGSVALAQGPHLLGQTTFSAPLQHSAELFPAILDLLNRSGRHPSDLNEVHLSIGPGSFTGLRIAVTTAKAMHLAQGVRIVTVDSLDAIAANVKDAILQAAFQPKCEESYRPPRLVAVLDAKRGQFYTALYEYVATGIDLDEGVEAPGYRIAAPAGGAWRKTLPDCLMTAAEIQDRFADPDCPAFVTGDGLLYHQQRLQSDGLQILDPACWSPQASRIHELGCQKAARDHFSDPLALVPFYLRGPEVTLRKRTPIIPAPSPQACAKNPQAVSADRIEKKLRRPIRPAKPAPEPEQGTK
jgi:tRNA threonylcarbamoyladenosine biosynthesis protein TsaB